MGQLVDLLEAYPLPEQKRKTTYQIYCDMDGVLTDFEGQGFEASFTRYDLKSMKKRHWVNTPKDFENFGIY